jgi:hypothetical protein
MKNIAVDYEMGVLKERELHSTLEKFFGCVFEKPSNKYSVFDFFSEKCYMEVKTRRNNWKTYPSTIVGKNKLDFAKSIKDRPVYFCFQFQDGLFYWIYNELDIENGYVVFGEGGRNDRGRNEYKTYAYLDVLKLKRIPDS